MSAPYMGEKGFSVVGLDAFTSTRGLGKVGYEYLDLGSLVKESK